MGVIDFDLPADQEILAEISKLDRFVGRWSKSRPIEGARLDSLRQATLRQSTAASCRLAGIRVSDAEVAAVLRDGDPSQAPEAVAIRGYAEALEWKLPAGNRLIDARALAELHARLIPENGAESSSWRSEPIHRELFDAEGRATGRVFSGLPPRMIADKTDELITWLEFELRARERHPALVIGTFALALWAISPFDRGNGRMTRVLTGLLLEREGYGFVRYASLESQLEARRGDYYHTYDQAQSGLWTGQGNLGPWVRFFLDSLNGLSERVESKLELEREAFGLSPLQRAILDTVREHGDVDAGLLIRATGANRNTLKDNLRRMVDRGVLERTGQRRGTRYRLASGVAAERS